MMTSLFSIFDPSISLMNMTWLYFFSLMLFFGSLSFPTNNFHFLVVSFLKFMFMEFLSLSYKSVYIFKYFISVFVFIFSFNFSSLFPLIFPLTSHLAVVVPMSLCFWMFYFSFSLVKKSMEFFSHLVPFGTPMFLMSFMVLIELVSMLIRPITLSIRLVANITAGHILLMILMSFSFLSYLSFFMTLLLVFVMSILELFVSLIQSYVFMILITMYSSE